MRSLVTALCLAATALPAGAYDLDRDLRRRARQLVDDVAAEPTTPATAVERMAVLLEWANAASLEGAFVPKNLTLAGAYVPHPAPGTEVRPRFVREIDPYIRQLAWLDNDPEAFGEISSVTPSVVEASTFQTIEVTWRVGSLGVAEGGAILASRHMAGGYSRLQRADAEADSFLTIVSSNPAVRFENDEAPVVGPYGGFRAAQRFPAYRLVGAALDEGDTVTLTYGDRSGGSRGFGIGPFTNTAIALPLFVDPGDGSFYELPLPTYEVIGGAPARVHGFAPSIVATGETFAVSLRTEDHNYNRATGDIPAYQLRVNGRPHSQVAGGEAIREIELRFDSPGVYRLDLLSPDGTVAGNANPVWVRDDPQRRIYWGETHGHCGFAEGQGTPRGYFDFARDDAKLDFVTLSEHDIWLTDGKWRTLNQVAKEYHRDGELVVFPGYEWSTPRARGGHHNVFFRGPGFDRVPVQEAWNLTMLYRGLRAKHAIEDVLIIPHAHQAGDWRLSDLEMETLIEIMSGHGTFEWFGQAFLDNGHRVGFVGASDDHIGHPGYSPGHAANPARRSNIFQFGGLAGAWAPAHSADSIFDALKARSAYATTGSQRIILDASLNGQPMGTEVARSETRTIEGRAIGTGPIRRVDLIRNGDVLSSWELERSSSPEVAVSFHSDSWVPFRDNPRGHITWRGSVTVENGRLADARLVGTPNWTSDELSVDGDTVTFDVATRGARRAISLELADSSPSTRLRVELAEGRETGTAPTQLRTPDAYPARTLNMRIPSTDEVVTETLSTGIYEDSVSVERPGLPDDVTFAFTDSGDPDDWYYVRVEQLDGHLAWSSPWWVGGERPR
ncbi:MAG: DUF3604 domain-containing protein [Acidobacteriota bacterium]|nr:DUF3604 domain-containing protein [Acidobacteriota bacterium]